jgi:hypothetical protein
MPNLVSLAEMRLRFNLPDEDTVNVLMNQSLLATSLQLETWLATDFDLQAGVVDQFLLPTSGPSVHNKQFPTFRLNNAFVSTVNSVKASGVRSELSNSDPITQADYVSTDLIRGLVSVDMLFPDNTFTIVGSRLSATSENWFFAVDYDSGFTTANQLGGSPVYQAVPEWLKEVAYLVGKGIYDIGGSCEGEELLKGPKGAMITALLEKRQRNIPYAVNPIFARV